MKITGREMTASLEDYLEAIYFLNGANGEVRMTDLAAELGISKPSVNRAVNTLKNQGYVSHEHYGGLQLTEKGVSIAKNIAKRHRMLKCFLMDGLGVAEEIAEKEACCMEHDFSTYTMEKLEVFLEKTLGKSQ